MDILVTHNDRTAQLSLRGRFDFHCHREFRSACEGALARQGVGTLEIDLGEVEYLDSSALGMLLLARERAGAAGRPVRLANCRGSVAEVLRIANFQKLFDIG